MRPIAALLVVLGAAYASPASWGPSGCAVAQTAQTPIEGWVKQPGQRQALLYKQGRLMGGWDYARKQWRAYTNGQWQPVSQAPWLGACGCDDACLCDDCQCCGKLRCNDDCDCNHCANATSCPHCPCECQNCNCGNEGPCLPGCCCTDKEAKKAFGQAPKQVDLLKEPGVIPGKISKTSRYSLSGKDVTRAKAFESIGATVPADGKALRLLFVGGDSCASHYAEWLKSAEWAKLKDKVICQFRSNSDWDVNDTGRRKSECEISLEEPDGTQRFLQQAFVGAGQLAAAVDQYGGVRKPDPSYDPNKVVNPLKTTTVAGLPLWLIAVVAAGAAFLFLKGQK